MPKKLYVPESFDLIPLDEDDHILTELEAVEMVRTQHVEVER